MSTDYSVQRYENRIVFNLSTIVDRGALQILLDEKGRYILSGCENIRKKFAALDTSNLFDVGILTIVFNSLIVSTDARAGSELEQIVAGVSELIDHSITVMHED